MQVSALLLTFNEERNLPRCLASLDWCDDILVMDSGSTDATVRIAEEAGARVIHRDWDNFAGQRNHGLDHGNLRHKYVLHLDADEVVPDAFREALLKLQPQDGIDAWRVPSKTILFGQWLRHAGMYPTYQVRLGHRDRLRFVQVGHGQREDLSPERVGLFDVPYLHYNFSHGMRAWFAKHLSYASDEAQLLIQQRREGLPAKPQTSGDNATDARRRAKARAAKMPLFLRPLARFFYVYLWRQGFRDGSAGLAYATMLAVYEGMTAVLAFEKTRADKGEIE